MASQESGAPKKHKEAVLKAQHESMIRTIIFTGRPLRLYNTEYIQGWENKPEEIKRLTAKGVIPVYQDMENDKDGELEQKINERYLMGQCAAVIEDIKSAKEIVDELVSEAVTSLRSGQSLIVGGKQANL